MLTSCEYSARIVQLFRAIIDGDHRDDCDDDSLYFITSFGKNRVAGFFVEKKKKI